MGLTSIGDQRTPGRPTEVTFAAQTGLPSSVQELLLIGHAASGAGSGTAASYVVATMSNVADPVAAKTEAETKFGVGSELSKMVLAAINANAGGSTFPNIKCVPLVSTDTDFGASDAALKAADKVKAEFMVSCYDGNSATLRGKLITEAQAMSGAQRVNNGQYGTVAVAANLSVTDPSTLPKPDAKEFQGVWLRDTSGNAYSVGELASAVAAIIAANAVPFNPVDGSVVSGVAAPAKNSDWITVGAGLESETALLAGWTPLRVLPNGNVAIVRAVTSRITTGDGVTQVTAYYDVQDYQVLYFWRKTLVTRLNQPDLVKVKASAQTAKLILSEVIRLASTFEDQGMFQNVQGLAKLFQVARSASDRHRFDIFTPVNVIPGLHVVASNVQATTVGDTLSI